MRIRPLDDEPAEPRYALGFHPAAQKEFEELPESHRRRFGAAFDRLRRDPFRPGPGMDIKKLTVVGEATGLYRLRIGDRRCVYATILEERFVVLLVIDERGAGYDRILGTALRRLSRFLA